MLKRRIFPMILALATILTLSGPALADDVVNGSTGPGSVYRLVRPSNWNVMRPPSNVKRSCSNVVPR